MENFNKILGYVLLVLGLVIIAWTGWQSYNIFFGKTSAPLVFKTPLYSASSAGNDITSQVQNAVNQQLGQVVSPDSITKIFNLSSWMLLAWIFILAGGTISKIGVKLIK